MQITNRHEITKDYLENHLQNLAKQYWARPQHKNEDIDTFHSRKVTIYDKLTQDIPARNFYTLNWPSEIQDRFLLERTPVKTPLFERKIFVFLNLSTEEIADIAPDGQYIDDFPKDIMIIQDTPRERADFKKLIEPATKKLNNWAAISEGDDQVTRKILQKFILHALGDKLFLYSTDLTPVFTLTIASLEKACNYEWHLKSLSNFFSCAIDVNSLSSYQEILDKWVQNTPNNEALKAERQALLLAYEASIRKPGVFCTVDMAPITFTITVRLLLPTTNIKAKTLPPCSKQGAKIVLKIDTAEFHSAEPHCAFEQTNEAQPEVAPKLNPEGRATAQTNKYPSVDNIWHWITPKTRREYTNMAVKKITYHPVTKPASN